MKIITIANQKGGVAKTTTAWNLSKELEQRGERVLMIDLDPQTNLSLTAGVDLLNMPLTLFDVFRDKLNVSRALIPLTDTLHILVGGIDLAAADRTFTQLGREKMLSKALEGIKSEYDFCIIDTPPTLGVMNENALTCSDMVIIPIQADVYALQGINQLYGFIEDIRENTNPDLDIAGILITRVDSRTNLHNVLYPEFKKAAGSMNTRLFNTSIRSTITVGEAALNRESLTDYNASSTASKDYKAFTDEFLELV